MTMKKTRIEYNRDLVAKIAMEVEKNKDCRFMQILCNCNIVIPGTDQFYEESQITAERSES